MVVWELNEVLSNDLFGFGYGYKVGFGWFKDPVSGWRVDGALLVVEGCFLTEVYGLGALGVVRVGELLLNSFGRLFPVGYCVLDFVYKESFYYWRGCVR